MMSKTRVILVTLFALFGINPSIADDAVTEATSCGGFDPTGFTEGNPVIRVNLMADAKFWEDDIQSCVVVIYGLKRMADSESDRALLAYKPKSVAHSEEVPKRVRKAAERALAKWLFYSSETHKVSEEPIYYSVFSF